MFALFAYVSAPKTYGEGFRLVSARQIFRVSSPCLFRLSPSWEIREIWRANEKDVNEGTDWLSEWRRLGRMIRENKYSQKRRESFRQAVVASLKFLLDLRNRESFHSFNCTLLQGGQEEGNVERVGKTFIVPSLQVHTLSLTLLESE